MLQAGVMVSVRSCKVRSSCSDKTLKVHMGGAQLQVGVMVTYRNYLGAAWLQAGIIVNRRGSLGKVKD
jgi:hypothetical protein